MTTAASCAAALVAAITISSPALASRAVAPANATGSFSITISGEIASTCTLSTRGDGDFGPITNPRTGLAEAATLALPFTMDCNAPYEASIASVNGGLAYQGQVESSFAPMVEYAAALDMGGIAGGVALACDSGRMHAVDRDGRSRCLARSSTDVGVAAGDGIVRLRLKPGSLPLQMGSYADQVILRIAPRVSG